jgi:hypothetical protein
MFPSKIKKLAENVPLPAYKNLKLLMMPIVLGDETTVPDPDLFPMLKVMANAVPEHVGKVVYLTIDQKAIVAGTTHRRPGLHVDGYPHTRADKTCLDFPGIWAGSGHGGTWGGGGGKGGGMGANWWDGTGLLTVASVEGCRAWNKDFEGEPRVEGYCEHLFEQCQDDQAIVLKAKALYWMSPGCVHESIPVEVETIRTFVRLSLPSKCDWYQGCTPNPLGVKPTGKTNARRPFMDY